MKQLKQMLPKHRSSPLQSLRQTPPSTERVSHIGSLKCVQTRHEREKEENLLAEGKVAKLAVIFKDLGEGGGI